MLHQRLQLRQSQSLALTPQLLQSIRLLQFSAAELAAYVDAEIERNPFLNREAQRKAGDRPVAVGTTRPAAAAATDIRAQDLVPEAPPSLAAHALKEIAEGCRDAETRRVGTFLAGHLDEAGWLDCEPDQASAALGLAPAAFDRALVAVQDAVEPAGLFARGLADCLAIQLRRRNRLDPVMRTVLANLDRLARRDFAALKRLTGEDEAGLMEILAEIRRLDPKPGHGFLSDGREAVVPDVLVSAAPDGGWAVELNMRAVPRVLVDERYAARVRGAAAANEGFVTESLATANWLARALDQRARTVLKVAAEIVRRQDDFLVQGVSGLKPMTLAAVAEAVGLHESTVSRVTSGKYVATPRGTFEMKFFFTVAIQATEGGEAHSATSVRHRIRTLVDAEGPSGVLSDDDIAERLRREGIDLARRTVAKYREALGIPSSVQRRREMNARRMAS
ncbi:RNA polymerase factor sigma-54 [Aureimonas leprariae]|uniref:RNA polymerase sigma-54 factor n=1 Tax=Plantimonas leprariae TaxID=2615207 RepID=A0A7V7TY70_9HYPH|nr:RNA polymerase factor sigma-54 [Aureimonas leprariae]KAB0682875.1 RNA polymerase factor sigma-54 [Aureimonas leprariae]